MSSPFTNLVATPFQAQVMEELMGYAEEDRELDLYQFFSRISAHQYLPVYALFERYLKKGDHVFDWGCGNGHFSYYLLRSGYQATGFFLF